MDTELFRAAILGDINVVKSKDGVTRVKDQITPSQNTVLHLASESGKTECVKQILKLYPSLLCAANSKGETALHLAVGGGHLDVVRVLLDEAGRSAERSENNVHMQLIRMLNKDKDSALHEAVRHNYVEIVRFLVEKDQEDEHSPNIYHMTPLYLAAFKGHVFSLKIIFENCIKPTDEGPQGRTLLHAAVMSGSIECVRYILLKRWNLTTAIDIHGWTALHYAAYFDFADIIKDVIEPDKSIAYATTKTSSRTALHIAAQGGNLSAVKQLIKFCPYLCDMIDDRGRNILHLAVEYDHKMVIEYILQNSPMIQSILNQKDKIGENTPLHYAATHGCFVPLLIKHELAHRDALNKFHRTPLDVIRTDFFPRGEQEKVEKLLVQIGASQNVLDMYFFQGGNNERGQKKEQLQTSWKLSGTCMMIVALFTTITLAVAAKYIILAGSGLYQDLGIK